MIKKNFLTGLAILLPIALTFWVVFFLINLLTAPFIGIVESLLIKIELSEHTHFLLTSKKALLFVSRLIILVVLFCIAILAGFLARVFFINYFFRFGDYLIHRIPFVNKIYKASQDIVHTLFGSEGTSFSHVVLVPFPHPKAFSLGLITKQEMPTASDPDQKEKVSLFLPGTPNPTMGFMLLFKRSEIVYLDMKADEALKFVISCGVLSNKLRVKPQTNIGQDIAAK
jgi:uncharacterized membrane protein